MPKQKKKRTKKYSGVDAKNNRPSVTRVQAVNRGKFGQWYFERKAIIRRVAMIALVAAVLILIIVGIVQLFV